MTDTVIAASHEPVPGRCNGRKRSGGLCGQPAGWGTDHVGVGACKLHLGATENHKLAAQRELIRREAARLGVAREVDPAAALLELVFEAAGNVEFYRDLVSRLASTETPGIGPESGWDGPDGVGIAGKALGAIYGRTFHQSGKETGEAKRHILVQMYDDERDRLKEYAATVVKVGLAERQVQVAELQAALVARVVMSVLDDPEFGLSFEQRELGRRLAGRHLRQLSAGTVTS